MHSQNNIFPWNLFCKSPDSAHMRQPIGSSLLYVIPCCLFGSEILPELTLIHFRFDHFVLAQCVKRLLQDSYKDLHWNAVVLYLVLSFIVTEASVHGFFDVWSTNTFADYAYALTIQQSKWKIGRYATIDFADYCVFGVRVDTKNVLNRSPTSSLVL